MTRILRIAAFLSGFLSVTFALAGEGDTLAPKRIKIFPFPAIGYAPETRWYVGAVALFNVRLSDAADKPSQVKLEFNYTQNKQFLYTESHELRFGKEKFLFLGDNGYFRYPEFIWYHGPSGSTDEHDIKIGYDANRLEIDNTFMTRVSTAFPYAGIRFRYHTMDILSADSGFAYAPGTTFIGSGLGPALVVDTRDNPLNARRGIYFAASFTFGKGKIDQVTSPFERGETDFRIYVPFQNNSVLAFQGVLTGSFGNTIPFRMLSLMGGDRIMRGYYYGRYRDHVLFATQAEYRATLWRWLGGTVFAGHGVVFDEKDPQDLDQKLSYGLGARFLLDKKDRINLRFDYGMGHNSSGFYVSFGEAF